MSVVASLKSSWRKYLVVPPILIGLAIVAFFRMTQRELPRSEREETAIPIQVTYVEPSRVLPLASGYGTALPGRTWIAIAEVGGRVVSSNSLRAGDWVSSGDVLLQIDDQDYLLREKQREADWVSAKAQLQQLRISEESDKQSLKIQQDLLKLREAEVDRLSRLEGPLATSKSEVDAAKAVMLTQRQAEWTLRTTVALYPSRIEASEASVSLSHSRLEEARRDVDRTKIVAPFTGVLANVNLEPDQYLATGQQVLQLQDVTSIEVESQFTLEQLSRLIPSAQLLGATSGELLKFDLSQIEANVLVRSGELSTRFRAIPVRIRESVDAQTRTFGVVVAIDKIIDESVPGSELTIRPGTFCEVTLTGVDQPSHVSIPLTAIRNDRVLAVDSEDRLRERNVRVAFEVEGWAAIESGLEAGDAVVTHYGSTIQPGQWVNPQGESTRESSK